MKSFMVGVAVIVSFAIGGTSLVLGSALQVHRTASHLVLVHSVSR